MLNAVADTGPLRYLTETGHIEILPALFDRILISPVVFRELTHPSSPLSVRRWMNTQPQWLSVVPGAPDLTHTALASLDLGERSALLLCVHVSAQVILIDDRKGAAAAARMGFETVGTLGLLVRASEKGLLDFSAAIASLRRTNFHCRPEMLEELVRLYS